jgi:predicted dehydrogenase
MSQLGLGIVGAGRIARSHLTSLASNAEGKAVAIYDVMPERAEQAAAEFGIPRVARSLEELLERRDVQAVIVCTPPVAHAAPAIAALDAGKHVLCEKPFALDTAEAERMIQAAEQSHRYLAVCSARLRCGVGARTARRLASSGELGTVYHVRCTQLRVRGRPGIDIFPDAAWFLDKARAGGGALIDTGVYRVDLLLWLLGYPRVTSVLCSTYQGIGPAPEPGVSQSVEDHATLMFTCASGASGVLETAWASNASGVNSIMVLGTKAALRFDPLTKITVEPDRQTIEDALLALPDNDNSGFGDVTTQFVRAILADHQPETPPREALEVTRLIDAAYRSAETGRAVNLSEGN